MLCWCPRSRRRRRRLVQRLRLTPHRLGSPERFAGTTRSQVALVHVPGLVVRNSGLGRQAATSQDRSCILGVRPVLLGKDQNGSAHRGRRPARERGSLSNARRALQRNRARSRERRPHRPCQPEAVGTMLARAPSASEPTRFLRVSPTKTTEHALAVSCEKARALLSFRLATVQGGEQRIEANAARFVRASGEEYFVLVCRDGSERRADERALRESAALFTNTFRASPISNSVTSVETGRILEINRAFEAYFEYSREEAIGSTTTELGLWTNPADRLLYVRELEQHGSIRGFEASLRNRRGQVGTYLMSAEPWTCRAPVPGQRHRGRDRTTLGREGPARVRRQVPQGVSH